MTLSHDVPAERPPASTHATFPNDGGRMAAMDASQSASTDRGRLRRQGIPVKQGFKAAARDVLDYRDLCRVQRPGSVGEQKLGTADACRCQAVRRSLEQG